MSNYLTTTFTVASQTALTSFANDDASTWLLWYLAGGAGVPQVYPSFGGVAASGGPIGRQVYRSSVIASAPDTVLTGNFYNDANAGYLNIGVGIRLNSATTAGYFLLRNQASSIWQIYKATSGTAGSVIASSSSSALATGGLLAFEFSATNSGAWDVVLTAKIGGVVVASGTDTAPGGAFVQAGYAGVFFDPSTAATGMFIDSMTASANAVAATAILVNGPASGAVGSPSSNFTVSADGTITGTVRVTPAAASGTFTPTFVDISAGTPTATFTYTPASSGVKPISFTNNGGLTNPTALTYAATSAAATAITLTGPTSGVVGVASSVFTLGANGAITGSVICTPSDGGAGGTFTPTTRTLTSGAPNATFSYTPISAGTKTISVANNGGLTAPVTIAYTASASGTITGPTLYNAIRFSPGNWEITSSKAKAFHPGAYMKIIFEGTSLALIFDTSNGYTPVPQLVYRVDGCGPWFKVALASTVSFPVPTDTNNSTSHFVEIVVKVAGGAACWNTDNGAVILTGAVVDTGKNLFKPPTAAQISTLWFGDSITNGDLTLSGSGNDSADVQAGWAYQIATRLNSEFGICAFGSTKWIGAGGGGTNIPGLVDSWNLLSAGVARDITTSPPKLIVINMGTNDGSDVTAAVTTTLNGMLAATPGTTRIAVLRPFIGYHAAEIQAGIAACSAPSRVTYIDTTGMFNTAFADTSGLHPLAFENVSHIVPVLYPYVAATLNTSPSLVARTVSGVLKLDAATLAANLTGLTVSFWDEPMNNLTTTARYQSASLTTNTSGFWSFTANSTLSPGGTGYVDIRGAGLHYCGPVVVA